MIQQRLKEVLEEKGVTVYTLSQLTGIQTSNLYGFYHDSQKSMSFKTIDKICVVLGLTSIGELIVYVPEEKSSKQQRNPLSSFMEKITKKTQGASME